MAFDSSRFRQVLGHYPTGVTVVTALSGDRPVGLTIGSFTSVSLDPALVGFLPAKSSESWPAIEAAGWFCVNVLADDQGELCWRFARDSDDKFAEVGWHPAPSGAPILNGATAWIDCQVHTVVDAGDHWFVMGLVHELEVERDHAPLVFWLGKLCGVTPP
jgi:flavin reductase (DIM6/NTAB) family NADH-FMN oxidoreductase RutF